MENKDKKMIKFLGIELEEGTFIREDYLNGFSLFDLKRNLTYCENSDGNWFKFEHNAKGLVTYIEDKEGNCVYFGDSNGEIRDERGNK